MAVWPWSSWDFSKAAPSSLSRKQRKPPDIAPAGSAVEMLVRQFAQPLAFLRELVQNSLDAGSNAVEVKVTYAAEEELACLQVADTGEGMDREIIDKGLTRLFASSKENDLTKIGKFGIGFVSVFALRPQAVVVDTGRNGEFWRLVFHPDRSFDRIRRDQPCEGTTVSVYHRILPKKFAGLVKDCHETLVYWCKHCDVPIRFNGALINQEFSLQAEFEVAYEAAGTEVVAACPGAAKRMFGFYNRGLTLMEGKGKAPGGREPLERFSFKVRSRYLEHTLTRDTIIQDKEFQKAMDVVTHVACQVYPRQLLELLAGEDKPEHWRAFLAWSPRREEVALARIFPTWSGAKIDLAQATGACYASQSDEVLESLMRRKQPPVVLRGDPSSPWWPGLQLFLEGLSPRPLAEAYVLAEYVQPELAWARVQRAAEGQLGAFGVKRVFLCRWKSAPRDSALSCLYGNPGEPQLAGAGGKNVGVDQSHASFGRLLQVARHDPSLACALLVHRCLLELALPRSEKTYHGIVSSMLAMRRP